MTFPRKFRSARRSMAMFILAALFSLVSGCSYFNAFYNTQRSYKTAEKKRERSTDLQNAPSEYQDAVDAGARLIEMYPESKWIDDALFLMGQSYYWLEDYHKARRKFEELQSNYPDSPNILESRMWLGKVMVALKKRDEATSILRGLIADTDDRKVIAESRFALAELYYIDSSFVKAAEEFGEIQDIAKDDKLIGESLWRAGESLFREKRYADAVDYLEAALDHEQTATMRFKTRLLHGEALRESGNAEEALAIFNDMLKDKRYFREHGKVRVQKGLALIDLGRKDEAFEEWQTVINDYQRSDESAQAYYQMAMVNLNTLGNRELAKEQFETARAEKARSRFSMKADTMVTMLSRVDQLTRNRARIRYRIEFTEQWITDPINPADTAKFYSAAYYDSLAVDTLNLASLWSHAWRDSVLAPPPDSTENDSLIQPVDSVMVAETADTLAGGNAVPAQPVPSPTLNPLGEYQTREAKAVAEDKRDEDIIDDSPGSPEDMHGAVPEGTVERAFMPDASIADTMNTPASADDPLPPSGNPEEKPDQPVSTLEAMQEMQPDPGPPPADDAPGAYTDVENKRQPGGEVQPRRPEQAEDWRAALRERTGNQGAAPPPTEGDGSGAQQNVAEGAGNPLSEDSAAQLPENPDPTDTPPDQTTNPGEEVRQFTQDQLERETRDRRLTNQPPPVMDPSPEFNAAAGMADSLDADTTVTAPLPEPEVETITIFDTRPVLDSLAAMRAELQDTRFQLGEIQLFEMEQPDSARIIFRELAEPSNVDSVRARALTAIAYIEREQGDSTAADSIMHHIAEEFPTTRTGRLLIEELGLKTEEPVTQAELAYREAEEMYFGEAEAQDAYTQYRWVSETYPNTNWAPRALYAAAYISGEQLGDGETAEDLLNQIIDDYPSSPQAQRARERISSFDAIRYAEADTTDIETAFADIDAYTEDEVDEMAAIVGGVEALSSTLNARNLLPQEVIEGTGGEVMLRYIVNADNSASNFRVVMEDPPGRGLGRALIAGLEEMQFRPAQKDGEPVATKVERRYTLPLDAPPNVRPLPKR